MSLGYINNSQKLSVFSKEYWRVALLELKDVRKLCLASLTVALSIVLKFLPLKIPVTPATSIQPTLIVHMLGGIMLGPILSFLRGFTSDILGFILASSGYAFQFEYTLIESFAAMLYSLLLYRKTVSVGRIFVAKASINIFFNAILTTLINVRYGYLANFISGFVVSLPKNILLLPFEVLLLVFVFNSLLPAFSRFKLVPEQGKINLTRRAVISVISFTVLIGGMIIFYTIFPDALKQLQNMMRDFLKSLFGI